MKETYQLATITDGKQDMEAILQILREMKSGHRKNDLKLLNYYQEVPISYSASIEEIGSDNIEVTVHQAQAVVIGLQKQTIITSSAFPNGLGVHSIAEYYNVKKCFAILGRFSYASVRAERRGAVRVSVEEPMHCIYNAGEQSMSGTITDISVTGIAMKNNDAAPAGIPEDGCLSFCVNRNKLNLPATFVKSVNVDEHLVHTFAIKTDMNADKLISQFIYGRQVEIIRHLKDQFS